MTRLVPAVAAIALLAIVAGYRETRGEGEQTREHPIEKRLRECLDKTGVTPDQVACEDAAFRQWDAELNRVYGELMRALRPKDRDKLRESQRAWLAFRDREFAWIASLFLNFEGTMYRPVIVCTRKDVVRRRALELQSYLELYRENALPPADGK